MKKMFTLGHKYFRNVALMVPNFVCFLHNLFRHWGLGSEGPCSASEGHSDTTESVRIPPDSAGTGRDQTPASERGFPEGDGDADRGSTFANMQVFALLPIIFDSLRGT